ncbi:MAG: O-antigen ligase family protein [Hyphomicrobiaceae bacterium]
MRTASPEGLVLIINDEHERHARRSRAAPPVLHPALRRPGPRSVAHVVSLALVWLTIFSGFFVVTEPAPFDALMLGLIVLLPIVGLTRIDSAHLGYLFLWLAITACEFVASMLAVDLVPAIVHTVVSLYLCLASFVLAAFIARNPEAHGRLIVRAYIASALVGATLGIMGYFDLPAGASELFTRHDRASAGFKDPNVYAPFLVPAMLYLLHHVLTRRFVGVVLSVIGLGILGLAVLLSFSRGAWVNLVIGGMVYAWLAFVTARTDRQRLKLVALLTLALLMSIGLVFAALEIDAVARLFDQRAALDQSYDLGPEGRFGGQEKAVRFILDNPLGLGPLQFGGIHHPEHPHNVYLSMFLNAGWIGGLLYLVLVIFLLLAGLRAVLRRKWSSPYLLATFAAFVGVALEGYVVETDHWRHFYILAGLLWGFAMQPVAVARRQSRLVTATRRVRQPSLVVVPPPAMPISARFALDQALRRPPRRLPRISGRAAPVPLHLVVPPRPPRRRQREPRRAARIIGPR